MLTLRGQLAWQALPLLALNLVSYIVRNTIPAEVILQEEPINVIGDLFGNTVP